ncbi:hypothetical protein [Legionella fallonii]|uniref:Uncharacterized protein n=1 Tax=Legionella fallonii LLAP-10 TaxID=1212491 RepID=A0A098G2D5_9GAMM|nr:hypothetical protein [Legionella fallonii]CEG56141.1 exported protein of unknown function [Legionella fallonii LLAP-10]
MSIIKLLTALLLTGLFATSFPVFAKHSVVIKHSFSFNPVEWHLTLEMGGFSIVNQTTKSQFVQVVLNKGSVSVFKLVNGKQSCYAALGGNSVINSTICELAAGEKLNIDLDYLPLNDARGTYQIEQAT